MLSAIQQKIVPLDSDLSTGQSDPFFEKLGPGPLYFFKKMPLGWKARGFKVMK